MTGVTNHGLMNKLRSANAFRLMSRATNKYRYTSRGSNVCRPVYPTEIKEMITVQREISNVIGLTAAGVFCLWASGLVGSCMGVLLTHASSAL